jgi:protein SCO1
MAQQSRIVRRATRAASALLCCWLFAACHPAPARAQLLMKEPPEELRVLDRVQKPGERIRLDLRFTDSRGRGTTLAKYFNQGKPVVLSLVYYDCPMICPLTMERLQDRLNAVPFIAGEDFYSLVVSFDHTNTTQQAATNKRLWHAGYKYDGKPGVEEGWEFFTSDINSVAMLAADVGFPYRYIPEAGEYAHGSAIVILTPEGVISRYLDGLGQDGQELRLALLEASEGKIARTWADFFLHRCFQWNASKNSYTLHAFRVMQLGAILTATAVATLLVGLKAGERARNFRRAKALLASGHPSLSPAASAPNTRHAMGQQP